VFAGNGIEAGAGFVEDEQLGFCHQGAADENALAFALGKVMPGAVGKGEAFDAFEDGAGGAPVGGRWGFPKIDHCVFAADDRLERGLVGGHQFVEGAADEADFFAQLGPVTFAEGLAEQLDVAVGGGFVAGECGEQCGFARTVGAEDNPVLTGIDAPIDTVKNDGVATLEAEVFNAKNRAARHAGLLTGKRCTAKRKFRLRVGVRLLGWRLNHLT